MNVMQSVGFPILIHCGENCFHRRSKSGLRSVFSDRRNFCGTGILGHEKDEADPSDCRRICQPLAVVTGGKGDDAPLTLLGGQAENCVECTPRLERGRPLQILGFESKLRASQTAQRCRFEEWCAVNVWSDSRGSRPYVIDC